MDILKLLKNGWGEFTAFMTGVIVTFFWFSSDGDPLKGEAEVKDDQQKRKISSSEHEVDNAKERKEDSEYKLDQLKTEEENLEKEKKKQLKNKNLKDDLSNYFENRK